MAKTRRVHALIEFAWTVKCNMKTGLIRREQSTLLDHLSHVKGLDLSLGIFFSVVGY